MSVSKKQTLIAAALLAGGLGALSAPALATNGQLPSCIGTYKCGMGGAGLGMATDATAAAVNPALAARMGNEAVVSLGFFHADVEVLIQGTNFGNNSGAPRSSGAQNFFNGSMGVNYRLNENIGANISFFPGGGGATDWGSPRTGTPNCGGVCKGGLDHQIRWRMFEIQAAVAYAPTKNQSYGLGLVVIKADMKTDSLDNSFAAPDPGPAGVVDRAWGAGFQVGGVWDVNDVLTLSADYHSRVWMERFRKYRNIFNSTVDRPPVITLGMDVKATDATTLALDLKYINNEDIKTISSQPAADGGFGWKDMTVIALGVQHQYNRALTFRAGYNYGKSPIDEEHAFANVLFPGIVEHHFTAGATLKFSNTMEFGWSAYITPKAKLIDSGTGDMFSSNNAGARLTHQQYGTQLSFKYNF